MSFEDNCVSKEELVQLVMESDARELLDVSAVDRPEDGYSGPPLISQKDLEAGEAHAGEAATKTGASGSAAALSRLHEEGKLAHTKVLSPLQERRQRVVSERAQHGAAVRSAIRPVSDGPMVHL